MNKKLSKLIVGAFALVLSAPNASAQTQLFTSASDNKPGYRIPSIVRFPDGKNGVAKGGLWAFADHRYQGGDIGGNNPIDITSRKLVDGTSSWTEPVLITHRNNSSQGYDFAFGDAATVADRESGKILLMTAAGRNSVWVKTAGYPNVARHVYDPETGKWTTTEATTVFYGPNNTYASHLFVSSGRMIQSTIYKKDKYYRIYAAICTVGGNGSRVAYSDDFGETWSYLGGPTASPIPNGDECKVEELPDGSILLNAKRYGGGNYGRYTNIFTFTDIAKGEGSWDKVVTSGTENVNDQTFTANCNAEIMLVPARKQSDGSQTYLLLLAGPNSTGRNNGCVFWKELPSTAAEYRKPSNYVSGWSKYVYSPNTYCAYITMTLDKDGNIALLDENGGISYRNYTLSTITRGAYAYNPSASGTYHTTSEPNFEHGVGGLVKPTLSVYGGTYTTAPTITLQATEGVKIYYTLDGSEPKLPTTTTGSGVAPLRAGTTTTGTQLYTAPITLSEGVTTLKALAVDNNGNYSRTVSASYYVNSNGNTTSLDESKKGKLGTTITLDHSNATNFNTSNGKDPTIWSYLRHNSTHIQLVASTTPDLLPGFQYFRWASNNMSWSTPGNLLRMANGKLNGSKVQQYSYYCILAPKGYRFLRYEFVFDKSSEDGASLQEYKYRDGSEKDIDLIDSKGTASSAKEVTFQRTLTDGTNVLYFRHDAKEANNQEPIVVKSIKLTYVVDEAVDVLVPNENGTKIHSGFVDLGTFSQPDGYNWGFSNNGGTDLLNVNVKKADGTTPETYSDGSNYYFLAGSDGDYYVEAPTKFRIVGATVNLKRAASVNFNSYIPSEATHGVRIVLGASTTINTSTNSNNSVNTESSGNYLKIDENGTVSNVTSSAQATVFTLDYHTGSGENHYSLKLPNGKYLGMNSSKQIVTLDNVDQALWSYNNGWKFPYNPNSPDGYVFIGAWESPYTWRAIAMDVRSAIAYRMPLAASDFTATVFNRENTDAATNGTQTLSEGNAEGAITVSDMNNDAIHIKLSGIKSNGAALFNVNLKTLALDPEVSTIEAAAKIDGKVVGNTPVASNNYVFNDGKVVEVPVPSTTDDSKSITLVLRNAANAEQTMWYTTGGNINNPGAMGGYSNLYLISSQADSEGGLDITTPYPDARTAVDQLATKQILATNTKAVAAQQATTVKDATADKSSIGNTEVTTTLAQSASQTDATQYYVYSADRPTWEIMPHDLRQGEHIDFRFYSIKVKPVEAEKPKITIVPLYTSTMKGQQHKKTTIASDGTTLNTSDKYVGIKVESQQNDGVTSGSVAGYLTAEAIEDAMKTALNKSDYKSPHEGDPLRNVLYVDMSSLNTVTTANSTTMADYAKATADNCLFFVPTGFAATNMANTIAKQNDGSYQAIGDVTVYDQQPFFTPHSFTTGQFKASYTRESTNSKALVRNMASVLPFDITLDADGHPYLNGETSPRTAITFRNITAYGELTGVKKDDTNHELTYAVVAEKVSTSKAEANKPYYVSKEESEPSGFEFSIPNATFVETPHDANDNTADPDRLQNANGTWTAHGTYNGVAPTKSNYLWYFSKELFWKSGQLEKFDVVNVRPFRSYYFTTDETPAEAKAAVVYDESDVIPTGIHDIQATPAHNDRVYTLDGRYVGDSLDNLAPGLYIQNGRKVVKQ